MKPIVALGIAALLFFMATGLEVVVASQACVRTCPTEGPDGDCGPACPDCFCCPSLRSCIQPDGCISSPPASTIALVAQPEPPSTKADPADIFHVPKTTLA